MRNLIKLLADNNVTLSGFFENGEYLGCISDIIGDHHCHFKCDIDYSEYDFITLYILPSIEALNKKLVE